METDLNSMDERPVTEPRCGQDRALQFLRGGATGGLQNAQFNVRARSWRRVLPRHVPVGHDDSGDNTLRRPPYFDEVRSSASRRMSQLADDRGRVRGVKIVV